MSKIKRFVPRDGCWGLVEGPEDPHFVTVCRRDGRWWVTTLTDGLNCGAVVDTTEYTVRKLHPNHVWVEPPTPVPVRVGMRVAYVPSMELWGANPDSPLLEPNFHDNDIGTVAEIEEHRMRGKRGFDVRLEEDHFGREWFESGVLCCAETAAPLCCPTEDD